MAPQARVNVYVDGFNLYYGSLKGTPYKWLDLAPASRRAADADARAAHTRPMVAWLLRISSLLFVVTGVAYLVVPGLALGIVGIASVATNDFILRTEGVALLCAGAIIWVTQGLAAPGLRVVLLALAVYFLLGSAIDLAAFVQGVVGPLSAPSAVVRILLGGACLYAAVAIAPDRPDHLR